MLAAGGALRETLQRCRPVYLKQTWLFLSLLGLFLVGVAAAETISWANPVGGNWTVAANWSPQDVPNEHGEDALFPPGGGVYATTLNASVGLDSVRVENEDATLIMGNGLTLTLYEAGGLNISGIVTLGGSAGTISGYIVNNSAGRVLVPSGAGLDLRGPAITNNGTLTINPTQGGADARLRLYGAEVTVAGSGEIVMRTAGDYNDALIEDYTGSLRQDAGHTIRGEGRISASPFTNSGTVDADVPDRVLRLDSGATSNDGTFMSEGGGILDVATCTITQGPSGWVSADGGRIRLGNVASVSGGTLSSSNGGIIQCVASGTRIENLTNLGQYEILTNCRTDAYAGTITNNGVFLINPTQGADNAYLRMYGGAVVFDGSGEIVMRTAGDYNDAQIEDYVGSLSQAASHTIRGEGRISVSPFTNSGTVDADVPDRVLRLDSGATSNDGTFLAEGGGILDVATCTITQGPSGWVSADGGRIRLGNVASVSGGTLSSSNGGVIQCVAQGTRIDNLTNLGQYEILTNCRTDVYGGTITNDGVFLINPTQGADNTSLRMYSGAVVFDGSGEIVLRTAGDPDDAWISHYVGSLTQAAGHTIRGDGRITAPLTNNGLVQAEVTGRELVLDSSARTNNGTLMARDGGTLVIGNAPTTQGPAGLIMADSGWVHLRADANISGGTLSSSNGGAIRCIGQGTRIDNLTNLGQYEILANCGTDVYGGTITNNGQFLINPTQGTDNAYLRMYSGSIVFDGSGEIILRTAGSPDDAWINHYVGSLTQAANHTIRGEGRVSAPLTNQGLIEADVPGRQLLLTDGPKVNYGTMRATGSTLGNTATNFTNNGIIAAADSGVFRTSSLSGNYSASTLSGGTWQVFAHSTMRLIGADIRTLCGRVLLDGPESNLYRDDGATAALANLHTIGDDGMLEVRSGRDFTTSGNLTIDFGGVTIGQGCSLTVNGQLTQLGNEEIPVMAGLTCVNGALTATSDPIDMQGGQLCGSGTIQNSVVCGGRVNPGASAGELTITGDYTQTEDGTCWIELGGLGEYDHLQINGQATLAGRLIVRSIDDYTPQVGDRFTILSCASRTGEFTLETGAPGIGLVYETYYYSDHVEIEIGSDPSYVPEPEIATEILPTTLKLFSRPVAGGGAVLVLDLPQAAQVTLELFDFSGRRVEVLRRGAEGAGRHAFAWDGSSGGRPNATGIYLARARIASLGGIDERRARVLIVR